MLGVALNQFEPPAWIFQGMCSPKFHFRVQLIELGFKLKPQPLGQHTGMREREPTRPLKNDTGVPNLSLSKISFRIRGLPLLHGPKRSSMLSGVCPRWASRWACSVSLPVIDNLQQHGICLST